MSDKADWNESKILMISTAFGNFMLPTRPSDHTLNELLFKLELAFFDTTEDEYRKAIELMEAYPHGFQCCGVNKKGKRCKKFVGSIYQMSPKQVISEAARDHYCEWHC